MVRGSRVMILSLCVSVIITFTAQAQQNPASDDPNKQKIQQIRQEMVTIIRQTDPIHTQIHQLLEQVRTLREQLFPLEQQLNSYREQLKVLRAQQIHNHN